MERHRLFRIIVLGGAGLVAACGGEVVAQHDAAVGSHPADAGADDDASETILFDAALPVDASPPIVEAGVEDGGFPHELPPP